MSVVEELRKRNVSRLLLAVIMAAMNDHAECVEWLDGNCAVCEALARLEVSILERDG